MGPGTPDFDEQRSESVELSLRPPRWSRHRQPVERADGEFGYFRERWHHGGGDAGLSPETERFTGPTHLLHRFLELLTHPLGGQAPDLARAAEDRLPGQRFDAEAETRREPERAQGAQAILAHARLGIPDGAQHSRGEVALPAKWVAQFTQRRGPCHRVDREVAAGQVIVERDAELDVRMSAVGLHVAPEGRDLVEPAVPVEHAHGAMLDADWHRAHEEPLHLLRAGTRREIPVVVGVAEQGIPNRAADAPRLEPGALEHLGDLEDFAGRLEQRHVAKSSRISFTSRPKPSASIRSMRACCARREPAKIAPISCRRFPPPG